MNPSSSMRRVLPALMGLFTLRLAYGLSMYFWKDDEFQIFLLGLDFFNTGKWPFFGPDVIHTHQQIAGALQPVLVGGPLFLWSQPEAPYLLLNLLSFTGLLVLGRWLTLRFKDLPPLLVYSWLMTLPWTLNISTHLYNPGYLLFSSCLFFVGVFESIPHFRTGLLGAGARRDAVAWFLMGFGLSWSFQLHLSWPLLVPFIGAAFVLTDSTRSWRQPAWLLTGLAVPALLLIPTIMKYGVSEAFAPMFNNSGLNGENFNEPLTIIARFLSLGAYEVPRFLTDAGKDRLPYVLARPWLIPFSAIFAIVGVVQPLVTLYGVFVRQAPPMVRWLVGLTLLEICVIFVLATRPPTTRNFYILFPVAALAAIQGSLFLLDSPRRRKIAAAVVTTAAAYQALLMISFLHDRSLYLNRDRIVTAIEFRETAILGNRRSFAR
jgi:hypothetical protein